MTYSTESMTIGVQITKILQFYSILKPKTVIKSIPFRMRTKGDENNFGDTI